MLVFRGVKNTGVRKNTNTPSCNASSIIPLWLRFFFTPVVFPSPLLFFLVRFSQQFVEIWKPSSSKPSKRQLEIYFNGFDVSGSGDDSSCFHGGYLWISMDFYRFHGESPNPKIPKNHLFSAIGSLETSIRVSAMGRPLSLV